MINRIDEARSNPALNTKEHLIVALSKYAGQRDVFVSFTTGFSNSGNKKVKGSPKTQSKIGINPRSRYETPLGIYSYPVDYVLDYSKTHMQFGAPFTGSDEWQHLYVVRRSTSQYIDNDTDLTPFRDKLYTLMEETLGEESAATLIGQATRSAYKTDEASVFWNTARSFAVEMTLPARQTFPMGKSAPVAWNVIMRKIGVQQFCDYDDRGIIHSSEPTQAVFFSAQAFRVIDVLARRDTPAATTQSLKKLAEQIKARKLNFKDTDPLMLRKILGDGDFDAKDVTYMGENIGAIPRRIIHETLTRWPDGLIFNTASVKALRVFGPLNKQMILGMAESMGWPLDQYVEVFPEGLNARQWQTAMRGVHHDGGWNEVAVSLNEQLASIHGPWVNSNFLKGAMGSFLNDQTGITYEAIDKLFENNPSTLPRSPENLREAFNAFPHETIEDGFMPSFKDWHRVIRTGWTGLQRVADIIPLDIAMAAITREDRALTPDDKLVNRFLIEKPEFLVWFAGQPNGSVLWATRNERLNELMHHNAVAIIRRNPRAMIFLAKGGDVPRDDRVVSLFWREVTTNPQSARMVVIALLNKWVTQEDLLKRFNSNIADAIVSNYRQIDHLSPELFVRSAVETQHLGIVTDKYVAFLFRMFPDQIPHWSGTVDSATAADLYLDFPTARNRRLTNMIEPGDAWNLMVNHDAGDLYQMANESNSLKIINAALKSNTANALLLNDHKSILSPLPADWHEWARHIAPAHLTPLMGKALNDNLASILLFAYPDTFRGEITVSEQLMTALAKRNHSLLATTHMFLNPLPEDLATAVQVKTIQDYSKFPNASKEEMNDVIRMLVGKLYRPTPEVLELYQDHLR